MAKRGRKPGTSPLGANVTRMALSVSNDMFKEVEKVAKMNGVSYAEVIRQCVQKVLGVPAFPKVKIKE